MSIYQTDTIYQVVRQAISRNQGLLAEQRDYVDFRNFNLITINLGRRSGHTTAAIRLLATLPNSYLITNSNHEYERVIRLIKDEQARKFDPSLNVQSVLNIHYNGERKALKAEYLIFDNASCMTNQMIRDLASANPQAFVIELG